jgi:predicted ribonuclease toxin of YeeF-YezG toxin-antitoxin module
MTSRDFAYWLQGLLEIGKPETLNKEQVEIIKNHLNLVFKHEIDPSLNEGKTKEEVKELQDVHDGKVDWKKMLKEGPPPKKDKGVVDWLSDKFKPSHIKPHKLHGGWESGSSDSTLIRC